MIPFNKPFLIGSEIQYIEDAVRSGKISGNGKYTKMCQDFFEQKYGFKIGLHFRKAKEKGITVGYGYVDILISPHYHKNNYLHNGDDFTPLECINSIDRILNYLNIEEIDRTELQIVNIEFGFNIIPNTDIKNIIEAAAGKYNLYGFIH